MRPLEPLKRRGLAVLLLNTLKISLKIYADNVRFGCGFAPLAIGHIHGKNRRKGGTVADNVQPS